MLRRYAELNPEDGRTVLRMLRWRGLVLEEFERLLATAMNAPEAVAVAEPGTL